jgi:hypothetical protein
MPVLETQGLSEAVQQKRLSRAVVSDKQERLALHERGQNHRLNSVQPDQAQLPEDGSAGRDRSFGTFLRLLRLELGRCGWGLLALAGDGRGCDASHIVLPAQRKLPSRAKASWKGSSRDFAVATSFPSPG